MRARNAQGLVPRATRLGRRGGSRLKAVALVVAITGGWGAHTGTAAAAKSATSSSVSDDALVRTLPGFENGYADVNGTRLHFVTGGAGPPLVLLPGWPETWWSFHEIMPVLATHFRVIAVDLRGMGGSAKPRDGYDKKTMAQDVYALVRHLGYEKVDVAGHDIGSMVAFSFAANHPEATRKVALMDVPHPDTFFANLKMLPDVGKFGPRIDDDHPGYPWWFALHQVKGLPETILAGRFSIYQGFLFDYLLKDPGSIGPRDRAVYAAAYAGREAIRASDAWYQAFPQDIVDAQAYPALTMPVLAIGSTGYGWLQAAVTPKARDLTLIKVENSGHFIQEEQPRFVADTLLAFFQKR